MRTVVLGPRPAELQTLIERRRRLGQDLFDEVWQGEYHVAPAPHIWRGLMDRRLAAAIEPHARRAGLNHSGPFNLGERDDYRVPDGGLHRGEPDGTWLPTAALVVEVTSPDDETWSKLQFYAAHGVDEVVVADPRAAGLRWLSRDGDGYTDTEHSEVLGVAVQDVTDAISWPA